MFLCISERRVPALASHSCSEGPRLRAVGEYESCLLMGKGREMGKKINGRENATKKKKFRARKKIKEKKKKMMQKKRPIATFFL